MHLELRLDRSAPRLWHLRLAERLAARAGVTVGAVLVPGTAGLPANVQRVFRLETLIHGLNRDGLGAPADPGAFAGFGGRGTGSPDLVLDLAGGAPTGRRTWRLDVDGAPAEAGLLAAAFARTSPLARLREGDATVATARFGTENLGVARVAFEDYLARTISLVEAALDGGAATQPAFLDADPGEPRDPRPYDIAGPDAGRRALRSLAGRAARGAFDLVYRAPHWRVGWRRVAGPDTIDLRQMPGGWTDLPDDGLRYYADPFPIEHEGRVTLFVEEYIHSLAKGVISAVEFGPEGPRGTPEPVLTCPYHLSYPFVFARDGAVWMIPESGANGSIDLYRASAFPGGWTHEAVLVDGVVAGDATLIEHGGRWWMFATVKDGGSYSDALYLWSAPDFRGPWAPHPRNPVLIDIASARPAGRMVVRDGALIRPVQDCRRGYGRALGLAQVTRLDPEGYAQSLQTLLEAGGAWPGRRVHTLNAAGGLEFVDGSKVVRRRLRAG